MKTFVDLFAGCGGLSLGFQRAGWKLRFAVEAHPDAFSTYQANILDRPGAVVDWPTWLPRQAHDISKLIPEYRDELEALSGTIDVIIGGPPCQGFSMNGRRQQDDPRNQMVKCYLELVELLSPSMVLIENVRGFTSMQHGENETFSDFVIDQLDKLDYDAWPRLLLASDWGVPQRRPRFFMVAVKKGRLKDIDPIKELQKLRPAFLSKRGLPVGSSVSVSDALDDLRTARKAKVADPEFGSLGFQCIAYKQPTALSAYAKWARDGASAPPSDMRLPRHTVEITARFQAILDTCPKGRSISPANRKRLGIKKRSTTPMAPSLPSPTITTLPDDLIHYSEPRVLTVREHARLQSFPDWFSFKGPYTSGGDRRKTACPRYTQVGNAVPPLLAEAIAEMLASLTLSGPEESTQLPNVAEVQSHALTQLGESLAT